MLINMDKSTQGKVLSQPVQSKNKQFKVAFTFLTGYNGNFVFTIKNKNFNLISFYDGDDFKKTKIPLGA